MPKSRNFVAMLPASEENPASSTWRVSDELGISQSNVVGHLHKKHPEMLIVPYGTNKL